MARAKKITTNELLDLAENIVREKGPAALTVAALASEAGLTNGGVQYAFKSKNDLLTAMYDRWNDDFDAQVNVLAGSDPDPRSRVQAHIEIARRKYTDDAWRNRSAVMMAMMVQHPVQMERFRRDSSTRLEGLDLSDDHDRRLLLALVAAEGALFTRAFGFMHFSNEAWSVLDEEIGAITKG